jgi:hypothetical protein
LLGGDFNNISFKEKEFFKSKFFELEIKISNIKKKEKESTIEFSVVNIG